MVNSEWLRKQRPKMRFTIHEIPFARIALASNGETETQPIIFSKLKYTTKQKLDKLPKSINISNRMIMTFIKRL